MPIPLFRFPLLVLDEVIKNTEPPQLFLLTLCSNRMHQVVENLRDKSIELELTLSGGNGTSGLSLHEEDEESLFDLSIRAMPEGGLEGWTTDKYPGAVFREDRDGLKCYWEDVEEGMRCLLEHMCDLFSAPVETVLLDGDSLWILDLVEELQGPQTYYLEYITAQLTDEQFRHLFVDLSPYSMILCGAPSEQFRIEHFHKTYLTLEISSGNWISGENLLTLDCARLEIQRKTFTVAEINRFFQYVLIYGGAPQLEEFVCEVDNDNAILILAWIWGVLVPIPGREQFEDSQESWKFSGLFYRGDRLWTVSIVCYKNPNGYLKLKIE